MTKLYMRIITLFILLLSFTSLNAQQYLGSEITWECIAPGQPDAGKYVFQLKLYGNCAWAAFPSNATLYSNSPAGNFTLYQKSGWPKDISPVCNSDSNFTHITCAGATLINSTGAVKEFIYRSLPVQLNGIPPATGWLFYHGSCCRSISSNITNQSSYRVRAIMYPYGTNNMYPCFDNSPTFSAEPLMAISQGYPTTINCFGSDKELDSLVYEWGQPQIMGGSNATFQSPYTYQSPFPGPVGNLNPNNVAATMNPKTGAISFTSYNSGSFNYVVKVTAYKTHNIKVAEIFREVNLALPINDSNSRPTLILIDSAGLTLPDTIYAYAGDNVSFNITGTSFDFLPNGSPETIELQINGEQFGSYIPSTGGINPSMDSTSGCPSSPCATLNPGVGPNDPLSGVFGIQATFNWQTDCKHFMLAGCIHRIIDEYTFNFMVKDDFCPIPAHNSASVVVKILPPIIPEITTDKISYNYPNLAVDISWNKYIDPDSNFIAYDIYHATTRNGTYNRIDSIKDINLTTYSHSNIGNTKGHYYLKLRAYSCYKPSESDNSDTLSIDCTSLESNIRYNQFRLYQNEPNPANGQTLIRYSIDHSLIGQFRLIDIAGQLIIERELQSQIGNNEITLDLTTLKNGIYYYQIEFNNMRKVKKLIILK